MSTRVGLAAVIVLAGAAAVRAQLQVQADKENVVASKLEGQWEPDVELTRRLVGSVPVPPAGQADKNPARLIVKSDPALAAKIPAKFARFFEGKQIYMAGLITLQDKERPFVLIEHKGNPHLVWFREQGGEALGDAESFNVMLAVAKQTQDDLLFIGGDFNNQPFSALRRAKAEPK